MFESFEELQKIENEEELGALIILFFIIASIFSIAFSIFSFIKYLF